MTEISLVQLSQYSTVDECVAHGGHCYVSENIVLASNPPQYPEKCKHCPASRVAIPQSQWSYRDTTPKETQ